jgi:GDP-mannose transporter
MPQVLAMRKRIKVTGFSDWDSMFYNNLLSIPVLMICSVVIEDWGTENLNRNLYVKAYYVMPI